MAASRPALLALIFSLAVGFAASAATVTGTVTQAATGQPLGSMVVAAYDTAGNLRGEATTDATGRYVLSLGAGSYRLLAYDPAGTYATAFDGNAESFDTTPVMTLGASSSVSVDFALVRGGTIAGVVRAGTSTLPGAVVEAYNLSGTRRAFTIADASGSYSLVLPPGTYKVVAYDAGGVYAPMFERESRTFAEASPVSVTQSGTSIVDFALPLAAHFRGRTIDAATAAPLAGITVFAYTPGGAVVSRTVSDSTGSFQFILPPGDYRFVAADPSRVYATTYFIGASSFSAANILTLRAGESVAGIEIGLVRGATVSGRVTDVAGVSVPNAVVAAYNADGSLHTSAITDSSGRYTLAVAPGSYRLGAADPSLRFVTQFYSGKSRFDSADVVTVVTSQALTSLDFALVRGGRFRGTVTAAATGLPLSGITVAAYDATGALVATTTSAANGAYALVVEPGEYRLLAFDNQLRYATAYAGGATSFDATLPRRVAAGAEETINLAMVAGIRVSGTVTDQHGTPLSGIEVFALDASGNRVGGAVSSSGAFALAVPPGTYRFVAIDPARRHAREYYDEVASLAGAKAVTVSSTQTPPQISFTLNAVNSRRRSVRH